MSFTQLISFRTDDLESVRQIQQDWVEATHGRRTARSQRLFVDRHQPDRYVVVVDFDSASDAAVNAALPETTAAAERLAALVGEVTYTDLELVDAESEVAS